MSDQPQEFDIDARIKFLDGLIANLERDTISGAAEVEAWSTACQERATLILAKKVETVATLIDWWTEFDANTRRNG